MSKQHRLDRQFADRLEVAARADAAAEARGENNTCSQVHRVAPFSVAAWCGLGTTADVVERFETFEEALAFFEQFSGDEAVVLWDGDRRVRYRGPSPECNPIQPA